MQNKYTIMQKTKREIEIKPLFPFLYSEPALYSRGSVESCFHPARQNDVGYSYDCWGTLCWRCIQ